MRRRVLLPSIGCLGASGLMLLACSLFGLSFGALAQEPKSSAAPRTVRANIGSSTVARPRETVAPTVSRFTQPRVARRRPPAQTLVAGSRHVESGTDEDKAAPLPPTKPTTPAPQPAPPPAAPVAVGQPSAPIAVAAAVLAPLPISAAPPIEVPIPVPEVPAVVEALLP